MYTLEVWVPTKGWKLIRKFKSKEAAEKVQEELQPLETKLTGKHTYQVRGKCCMPISDLSSIGG